MIARKYFSTRKKIVEEALDEYLTPKNKYPSELFKAMRYSVFSGGKRVRPILLFATYEMLKGRKNIRSLNKLKPLAAAIEMVHTASLIHDDLPSVDDSDERRGKAACHKVFGEATAILAGDALLTKAFETVIQIRKNDQAVKCLDILTNAVSTRGMIGGQVVDILSTRKKVRLNVLRYIHLKKTGALLQAAVELACLMFGAEENITIMLGNFALNLGLAYQISDDLLDEFGTYDELGREPREDMRNNKATYPSIAGTEKSKRIVKKLIKDSYNTIKNMKGNDIHLELLSYIEERLPE